MPAHTHVTIAWKSIQKMPTDYWIDTKAIAKSAGLSVHTMSRFLYRASQAGLVNHKEVHCKSVYHCLWKRNSQKTQPPRPLTLNEQIIIKTFGKNCLKEIT